MSDASERWQRVATRLRERMGERGVGPSELVTRAGVSRETLRPLLNAERDGYRPATLAKVALALGWRGDGIERLLNDEEPEEADGDVAERITAMEERLQRVEDSVREILRRVDPTAPPAP